jgi:hypothetical protein
MPRPRPTSTRGRRRTVGAILITLGSVMLIVGLGTVLLAAAGANDDVGVTWSNNPEARHTAVIGMVIGFGGLASVVAGCMLRLDR